MAAITPTTRTDTVAGNLRGVFATFSAVADTNTWASGLGLVTGVFCDADTSSDYVNATASGGTITFHVNGGPAGTTNVVAYGF